MRGCQSRYREKREVEVMKPRQRSGRAMSPHECPMATFRLRPSEASLRARPSQNLCFLIMQLNAIFTEALSLPVRRFCSC